MTGPGSTRVRAQTVDDLKPRIEQLVNGVASLQAVEKLKITRRPKDTPCERSMSTPTVLSTPFVCGQRIDKGT